MCDPQEVDRATELFHRDGFVAVRNVLSPEQLARMQKATDRVLRNILEKDPDASFGGEAGGLPHSYRFLPSTT